MSLLLASAAVALGGCHKSQVMMGVATNFPAPTPLDYIDMTVQRDGVPLFSYQWEIAGGVVQAGQFNLPGSLNVYAEGATEPNVQVKVRAMRNLGQDELVSRDARFSLIRDKELFMRLTLVRSCLPVSKGGTKGECGVGETCVEGECKTAELDSRRFPLYKIEGGVDPALVLGCSSGNPNEPIINTKTGEPLPIMNDCASDEFCQDGVCLKKDIPGSGVDAGTGAITCDPLNQSTCASNEKCYFAGDTDIASGYSWQCALLSPSDAGPPLKSGEPCTQGGANDRCERGSQCLLGYCQKFCDVSNPMCEQSLPNTSGFAYCLRGPGNTEYGAVRFCGHSCDALAAGATSGCQGGHCTIVLTRESSSLDYTSTLCVSTVGSKAHGEVCADTSECQEQHLCLGVSGEKLCRRLCDVTAPSCPARSLDMGSVPGQCQRLPNGFDGASGPVPEMSAIPRYGWCF